MLAYELYLKNIKNDKNPAKSIFPLKKIFVKNNEISVDGKTLDNYASEKNQKFSFIQEWLQMPLITTFLSKLNLPYRYAGANSRKPYLLIYGSFESTKKKDPVLKLAIDDKSGNKFVAELDLLTEKEKTNANGEVLTKIDKENYKIADQSLFEAYVNAGI